MALNIQTFSNVAGPSTLFKALGHPEAAGRGRELVDRLAAAGPAVIYDPLGQLEGFATFYDMTPVDIVDVFAQDIEHVGADVLCRRVRPVTELPGTTARVLMVAAFDAAQLIDQIRHLLPDGMTVLTLDEMRLPDAMLTNARQYLAPLNFVTNFAFFRDGGGSHTRLVTANYWGGYGARDARLWATLFDGDGSRLATWEQPLPAANGTVVIDSAEVRQRFGLGDFTGQLFIHILGAAGHDIVKYALDTYGDAATELSCTHDANAWPADLYAGLPAPRPGETVVLWVQNSHPCPIRSGEVGLALMGRKDVAWLDRTVPGFASHPLNVADLLPEAAWPDQFEVHAGRHFVRPRYEVTGSNGRRWIAHANVERTDLKPDPRLPDIGNLMGKGFILPAPVPPPERYSTTVLPTPMATSQQHLPIALLVADAEGREVVRHRFGVLARSHSMAVDVGALLEHTGATLAGGYGHVELVYDFDPAVEGGADGDGWLHALFRYEDRTSGHAAETSFGSHMFNTVLTYRNEPQSYAGRPPGLSTRLFLRLGTNGADTLCHLIYPASTMWHPVSRTSLGLMGGDGREVAARPLAVPCGGSRQFRVSETFTAEERAAAGPDAYVLIRDRTCRLFGYHGLVNGAGSFSLDHMFGF